jgi:hypothetical protein
MAKKAKGEYIPKPNKEKENLKPLLEKPVEIIQPLEVEEQESREEVILTPCSVATYCKVKNIIGLNRDFLQKKYGMRNYSSQGWDEILVKEKINI